MGDESLYDVIGEIFECHFDYGFGVGRRVFKIVFVDVVAGHHNFVVYQFERDLIHRHTHTQAIAPGGFRGRFREDFTSTDVADGFGFTGAIHHAGVAVSQDGGKVVE